MSESGITRSRTGSAKGLFQLNRQIHDISQKKGKLLADGRILGKVMKEFNRLVFDKVALENAGKCDGPNAELDFQIARVIMGHLRAAANYFDVNDVPLNSQRKKRFWLLDRHKLPWTNFCLSKRAAEARLHELAREYLVLRARHTGIKATIKRFEEDNKALRQDVAMIQRFSETQRQCQGIENTWNRMANADLLKSNQYQAQDMGRRRLSAISVRSVSSASTRPLSIAGKPASAAESWLGGSAGAAKSGAMEPNKHLSTRRRSGASCMNIWGSESDKYSLETAGSSLDSSQSSLSRPKRYSSYDSWGKKIPVSVLL